LKPRILSTIFRSLHDHVELVNVTEVVTVSSENDRKTVDTLWAKLELLTVKASDPNNYRGFKWLNLNSINQLIFVMVKCGVLFEVRTEFLNNI
jgi:hypothetical protein